MDNLLFAIRRSLFLYFLRVPSLPVSIVRSLLVCCAHIRTARLSDLRRRIRVWPSLALCSSSCSASADKELVSSRGQTSFDYLAHPRVSSRKMRVLGQFTMCMVEFIQLYTNEPCVWLEFRHHPSSSVFQPHVWFRHKLKL